MGLSDETGTQSFRWLFTGWRGVAVGLFALFSAMLCATSNIAYLPYLGLYEADAVGSNGFAAEPIVGRAGSDEIARVTPGGAADRAGLKPGMVVQFDQPYQAAINPATGQTTGMIVTTAHGFTRHHVVLSAQSRQFSQLPPDRRVARTINAIGAWLALVLGIIALVRGWGSLTALALGLGMLAYGNGSVVPFWATAQGPAVAILIAHAVAGWGGAGLLLLPVALYTERVARPSALWAPVLVSVAVAWAGYNLLEAWCQINDASYPVIGSGDILFPILLFVLNVQGLYWGWRGWRESSGTDRDRFITILAATAFQMFNGAVFVAIMMTNFVPDQAVRVLLALMTVLLIPLALAYAVLRHRVVDLGFALNRTVVYATFSAILLGTFGLIEWGVEHLLPEQWVKASAWIDAGVAVLVYLAFHRVHGAVEHRVEQVFFRQWQANEDALRRFVGSAAYFEDTRALARAFADELARFGGDARVAVYRRNDGALDRVGGTWDTAPRHFREDDPAFALMRAERAPLDLVATTTDLPGVLALPMLDHGVLAGLVLMDLKGNGALYRPDEVAQLGWATHEVGLALAALHANLIETENRLLKSQLARLSGIIGDRLDRVGA